MKTKIWVMLLSAVLLVCIGLSVLLLAPGSGATHAKIYSGGQLIRTVDLRVDQIFTVAAPGGGENTVTVSGGRIAVTAATCPDHYCMDRGYCTGGAQIVCLPNRLVIEFVGESSVDGVVG